MIRFDGVRIDAISMAPNGFREKVMKSCAFVYGVPLLFALSAAAVGTEQFEKLDSDHSGDLSQSEGQRSQELTIHWADLDKDGDGKLNRAEFTASVVKQKPIGLQVDDPTHSGPF
jgi:hypothetical protein